LQGRTNDPLALATRRGIPIDNIVAAAPTEQSRQKWARQRAKHPKWKERTPDVGIYNCAGMVWASRRTAIYDDFHNILRDDAYRIVDPNEDTCVGDIVIFCGDGNNHVHVGLVIQVTDGLGGGQSPKIPHLLLSKWDDSSGEYMHLVTDHCCASMTTHIEYWTDRPKHGAK
jgi:hypothetical protein